MKIGVEEEFIVVDPDTLFYSPGGLKIGTQFLSKHGLTKKFSVELGPFPNFFSNLKDIFSIVEIKTSPHKDVDSLREELKNLRNRLIDAAEESHYYLLPTGLHPLYSSLNSIPYNCASLHVHLDCSKKTYFRLLNKIPYLISVSVNSPFINGKQRSMSNRCEISPYINIPTNLYKRTSDLIINNGLSTVEVRVLDQQITIDETIGLSSLIRTIAENNVSDVKIDKTDYINKRNQAIKKGRGSISLNTKEYDIIDSADNYVNTFLNEMNGASWQIKAVEKVGFPGLISSLWSSLKSDKKTIKKENSSILDESINKKDLVYLLPYSPFLCIDKIKKYNQDLSWLKKVDLEKSNVF